MNSKKNTSKTNKRKVPNATLTPKLLRKYKKKGKSDTDIGLMYGRCTYWVWKLRKKYEIQGLYNHHHPSTYKKKVQDKVTAAIFREYRKGTEIDDICKSFGIDYSRFNFLHTRYSTSDDKTVRKNNRNKRKRNELLCLQKIHKTDYAIAKVLGITHQRVQQIRVEVGIPALRQTRKTAVLKK